VSDTRPPLREAVLGYAIDALDLSGASDVVVEACRHGRSALFVVTLNPEIVVRAERDEPLRAALQSADLTVADGVGILWAARRHGVVLPGRVPGVDLSFEVMRRGGHELRVAMVGGRPGVAERAAERARERWGVDVVLARHGYFDAERDGAAVADEVAASGAQLLLAGLGEQQEVLLERYRSRWGVGAMIGVGGTLDVLAGTAKRTPAWTRRSGLEWAWRVGLDPSRWHRLPRLARFVLLTLRWRRPSSP